MNLGSTKRITAAISSNLEGSVNWKKIMSPITLHYYITAASSTDLKSSTVKYWDLYVLFDYTGSFRRNFPHLKKMFLRSHYINIAKKTQSEFEGL